MLENIYTTKMSANKKQLQSRFYKIRARGGRFSKTMAAVMALVLCVMMLSATVVMAAVGNEPKNFFIDGKGYAIEPILIENQLATHTDNYYVPLRKTFEALGYTVTYDADKAGYERYMDSDYNFPSYDSVIPDDEFYDEEYDEWVTLKGYNAYAWQKPLVTNEAEYYIYGATGQMNRQMPVIEMTKNDIIEFCQVGSRRYSTGYALAPVLIDGVAYLPLRAVANIVGGIDTVQWNDAAHDTYFEGALTFDEETMTVQIFTK